MYKAVLYILVVWFVLLSYPAHGQSGNDVSRQIWVDVNPAWYFSPESKLFGDIGFRKEFENNGWLRFVIRPSIQTWLGGRFYFTAGIGNFFTRNEAIENRWEVRPFQGLSFNWPRWKAPLNHYFRLEERFDFNTSTWESKNSIRLRYRLQISYRWSALQPGKFWQASLATEAFGTLAGQQGQFQEQVRVTAGLDRSYAYDLHFRIEITWQQEKLFFSPGEYISDIYFRFRFTRSWGDQQRL